MTDNRLKHLTTYGNELREVLRPEGSSPLHPQEVVDALGADVLGLVREIEVQALNGNPSELGRLLASSLEEHPLSYTLLSLIVGGINSATRFIGDDLSEAAVTKTPYAQHQFMTAAIGFQLLRGFATEAFQVDALTTPNDLVALGQQSELREWLLIALRDSKEIYNRAVSYGLVAAYDSPAQEALSISTSIEKIRSKVAKVG